MLELLVKQGAALDPWFSFPNGLQIKLLHVACRNGSDQMVEYLLKQEKNAAQACQQTCIPTKSTVMHLAAQGGNIKVMDLLTKYGADPVQMNEDRDTPLHVSVRHGHDEFSRGLVKLLKAMRMTLQKVDVENKTENMTPYHIAILTGQFELGELLVKECLADPNKKNSHGKKIQDLAQEACSRKACDYLGLPEPDPFLVQRMKETLQTERLRRRNNSQGASSPTVGGGSLRHLQTPKRMPTEKL